MPFLPGTYAGQDAAELDRAHAWVDSLHVGGVIVSIGSPLDIAAKLNALQRRSALPLLVAADLEGGTASRFPGGTPFPSNMGVAATMRDGDAYTMGWITAVEARATGIHLAFAPVADVNSNPNNPIINTRSFGADPARVGRLVVQAMRGMQEHGLFATAKHFPGHGDTETDTHLALPSIAAGRARLDSLELAPFRAAIGAGVTAIMSAHIVVPALDPSGAPATLSPALLEGLLRDTLGFRGLVVTDALDMQALHGAGMGNTLDDGEIAVRAVLAGADLLLMPADPAAAIDAVVAAVEGGRIDRARIDRSVRRILALKERAGLFARRTVPLARIPEVVGRRAHRDSARAVTARALVLVRNRGQAMEALRASRQPITLVTYTETDPPPIPGFFPFGVTLARGLESQGRRVLRIRLTPATTDAALDSLRHAIPDPDIVVAAVAVRAREGAGTIDLPPRIRRLLTDLASRPTGLHLLSFGSPYVIREISGAQTYLLAWIQDPLAEDAAALALAGAAVTGRLPVPIPGIAPLGAGIDLPATP